MTDRTLRLDEIVRSTNALHLRFALDDLRFHTTYWYEGIDLYELERRHGAERLWHIYVHIAAYEANKIASLRPDRFDPGDYADHFHDEFVALWQTIFRNVWAQWRYQNDLPQYLGPALPSAGPATGTGPLDRGSDPWHTLAFCGGGKDSLAAMTLLDQCGMTYDALVYSSSIYGLAEPQHRLIGAMAEHTPAKAVRRQWIYEDVMDSPVIELRPDLGARTLTAAETPSSIFASLPYVLAFGYRYIVLAHERSADTGQVYWDATGEDVNHQWGKSYEAEALLNDYIQRHLVHDFQYFSILKPIYDINIFGMLRKRTEVVPFTHSCNIDKPWCLRCPKCAYVWLGYAAFLDPGDVTATFGEENPLDLEENRLTYRQLVGLESQLPFECIGQRDEARLLFELCHRKGYTGAAMDTYLEEARLAEPERVAARYLDIERGHHGIPEGIWQHLQGALEQDAAETDRYMQDTLAGRTPRPAASEHA